MDYILFGAGTGASLAVIGWILREWGPRLRDGKSDDNVIYSASDLIDRMSWARFCATCGMAMVAAGTLILLTTAIVAAWNPGDELASRILVGTYLFVSLLLLVWAFLYTRQFGTIGIYRPVTVDPKSETREAVAVVERESPASSGEVTSEGDSDVTPDAEPPAEPEPDFAEVAARRGGLGRFASFFNRQRPVEIAVEDDGIEDDGVDLIERSDIETDQSDAEGRGRPEIREVEVISETVPTGEDSEESAEIPKVEAIAETDASVVEIIDTIDVEEIEGAAVDTPEPVNVEADPSNAVDVADPVAPSVDQDVQDTSVDAAIEEPTSVANPEDEALAELRRRRLARLSGENQ